MKPHKDLPTGSQPWANEVDQLLAEVKQLKEVVRRLTENAGIDFSNPQRGINKGDTPSVQNPVGQKLSSLADVGTYNVADKQVLTWSQQGQKWLPTTPSGGSAWELATDEEHLWGDLDADSDYYSTQVMGLKDPYPPGVTPETGGTGDGYGLVGTSTSSAFLHAAQRLGGGTARAHGYVAAQPYYIKMGVVWIDDDPSVPWRAWSTLALDRRSIYLTTPQYQTDPLGEDGGIILRTNWFITPQFATADRPVAAAGTHIGAMIYDTTLNLPIWWNGTAWTDALGTTV